MITLETIIRESDEAANDFEGLDELTKFQILAGGIKVARLYFEIAAEAIGEEAVRAKRDAIMKS